MLNSRRCFRLFFPKRNSMRNIFLENLWRWKCGLPEDGISALNTPTVSLKELRTTEWSRKFENLMRNRLVMGALRYGRIGAPNKPTYDRTSSMIKRLEEYSKSGNKEFLVDVANLCMLEFTECKHPKAHFSSIDDGEHVNIIKNQPWKQ